jgi:hypothetical protein
MGVGERHRSNVWASVATVAWVTRPVGPGLNYRWGLGYFTGGTWGLVHILGPGP